MSKSFFILTFILVFGLRVNAQQTNLDTAQVLNSLVTERCKFIDTLDFTGWGARQIKFYSRTMAGDIVLKYFMETRSVSFDDLEKDTSAQNNLNRVNQWAFPMVENLLWQKSSFFSSHPQFNINQEDTKKIDEKIYAGLINKGQKQMAEKKYAAAVKTFKKLYSLNNNEWHLDQIAGALIKQKKYDEAASLLKSSLYLKIYNSFFLNQTGENLELIKRWDLAMEFYQKSLYYHSIYDCSAYFPMGKIYFNNGQYEDALNAFCNYYKYINNRWHTYNDLMESITKVRERMLATGLISKYDSIVESHGLVSSLKGAE